MTQQYIIGQFSALLGEMQPIRAEWLAAVSRLRREVESSPVSMLPRLLEEAMGVSDTLCWNALEQGEMSDFGRYAETAAALRDFGDNAGLR